MAFTKTHFEKVALILNTEYRIADDNGRQVVVHVAKRLADVYAAENGRFDSRKFLSWVTDTSERS